MKHRSLMTLLLLTLATPLLIACSNGVDKKPKVEYRIVTERTPIVHPQRPVRPILRDEKWIKCQNEPKTTVCMSAATAFQVIENKVEIGRYMDRTDSVIDYYRNLDKPKQVSKSRKPNTNTIY